LNHSQNETSNHPFTAHPAGRASRVWSAVLLGGNQMKTKNRSRNTYLDWLRVLGILFVFIYHSTRLYNIEEWKVKNDIWYPSVEIWNGIATSWMMPLMFVISGASLYYAIGKSSFGQFLKDKFLRLILPLLVANLTHLSIQPFLEQKSHGLFSGNFFQFIPVYFQAGLINWLGFHLWYLAFLFLFSILLFPLMRWLKGNGLNYLGKINRLLAKPFILYMLTFPLLFLYLIFGSDSPILTQEGGYPYIMYIWFVLLGFFLVSDEKIQEKIHQLRWVSLFIGLLLVAGFAYLYPANTDFSQVTLTLVAMAVMRLLGGWICVLAFFGLGKQYLTKRSSFLEYGNEAVLPFYILHQTAILVVAYFVLQWGLPDAFEWAVVVIISFALIVLLYEFLIRRWNVMRVLFGMKAKRSSLAKSSEPRVSTTAKAG
jgi:peptidoglycan/LPS O-acetylase OafA/YrhL